MAVEFHTLDRDQIAKILDTDPVGGLSTEEAKNRFKRDGPNELVAAEKISPLKMFLLQFKDFIVFLLVGATIVSIVFGEYIEALIILIIVILNGVLGFVQEYRAEEALEKLKQLTGDDTIVMRDGREVRVDTRDLVQGDLLLLWEGETIAADARIIEASRLRIEEGILTGESVPVDKTVEVISDPKIPLADRINSVFMGTTTVKGRGKAIITRTGMATEMGKIARSTVETEEQPTPLQIQLDRLGKILGIIVLLVVGIVLLFQLSYIEGDLIEGLEGAIETAIALAVSAVPEGLAAAITLTLAIGVQKMARKKAIIRKLPAVETLGSVEVICTDKTGTLTQNKMTVQRFWTPSDGMIEVTGTGYTPKGGFIHVAQEKRIDIAKDKGLYQAVKAGALCNTASVNYSYKSNSWECEGDPTEGALLVAAMKAGVLDRWEEGYQLKKDGEIFFDSDRKRMSMVFKRQRPGLEETWGFMKGSPKIVLDHCSHVLHENRIIPLTEELRHQVLENNSKLGSKAFRVLGLAEKQLPNDLKEFNETTVETEMIFLGLVGMIDPPREEVEAAIAKCKNAGIRVIMITGDQLDTALAIARSLDLKPYEDTFYLAHTSAELEAMNDEEFKAVVSDLDVCARASPGIKRRIVETLQDDFGHVVAMTGDGVNDAPALKKADIGVAMGITGTDVAREASDMILADDNFASIVAAVEEGRTIYDNMKKFIRYLLSSNFDEILVVFTATVLLGLHSPYLALGILWINLLTDGLPALALSVDPGDPDIMKRKPRGRNSGMMGEILGFSLIAGIISFSATMILFLSFSPTILLVSSTPGSELTVARTLALTVSVIFELGQVFVSRAPDDKSVFVTNPFSNLYLLLAVGTAFILHLFIIYVGPLASIFELAPLSINQWGMIFGIVIIGIILLDVAKVGLHRVLERISPDGVAKSV
ncbi:MAG: cation-translocating P-type ATPase [Candidatus Thorarchaeota archaeon]